MAGARSKHYSVNDSDLAQLSTYGGLASWSFALGSLLLGMSFDLVKDIVVKGIGATTQGLNPSEAFWVGVRFPLLACGALFIVVAVVLVVARHSKASQIKKETQFLA